MRLHASLLSAVWAAGLAVAAQDVKVGRIAAINSGEPGWTSPERVLFYTENASDPGFYFALDYKVEDNAKHWRYNNTAHVKVEREAGGYGYQDWEEVWSDSASRSKRWVWETYKVEGRLRSPSKIVQSDPVARYRIFLTGQVNSDTYRLGGNYYDRIVRPVIRLPDRGGRGLGVALAASWAARASYDQGEDAFHAIGDSDPNSEIQAAMRNLELNGIAFIPLADWFLAETTEAQAAEAAEALAGRVRYAGGVFTSTFMLVEYTQKSLQVIEEVTDDVNTALAANCYKLAMGDVDDAGVVDGPDGMGSYRGYDLARNAANRAIAALTAYGYGSQSSREELDRILDEVETDLIEATADFDTARTRFAEEVMGNGCSFSIAGADNQQAAIERAQQFFDEQQLAIAGQLMALATFRRIPTRTIARKAVPLKIGVNALNDRPAPIKVRLQGFDGQRRSTHDGMLTFGDGNNRWSTETAILPAGTRRIRLTFTNDAYNARLGADGDRNFFVDFIVLRKARIEAEDFVRTGGNRGDPGCGRRTRVKGRSGGGFADCGNGGDWVEYDLP